MKKVEKLKYEQIIEKLDICARAFDGWEYGLPTHHGKTKNKMINIIHDILNPKPNGKDSNNN